METLTETDSKFETISGIIRLLFRFFSIAILLLLGLVVFNFYTQKHEIQALEKRIKVLEIALTYHVKIECHD